jgi:E3 ubiquitin-protein ligase BOI-like protein
MLRQRRDLLKRKFDEIDQEVKRREDEQAKRQKREEEREGKCVICITAKACVLLQPCMHVCVCNGCEAKLKLADKCPICTALIADKKHVFLV